MRGKLIAVKDLVTGQEGRMIPGSRHSSDVHGTIEIQIVPKGIFNVFKRVWIKNIPMPGGMTEPITPQDTSLVGTEQSCIYILNHSSREEMTNSIIKKLKIYVAETMDEVRRSSELESMKNEHLRAKVKSQSDGIDDVIRDHKRSEGMLIGKPHDEINNKKKKLGMYK